MCPSYCFMTESNCWLNSCFVFCEKSLVKYKILDRFLPRSCFQKTPTTILKSRKSRGRSNVTVAIVLCSLVGLRGFYVRIKEPSLTVFNKESNKNFGWDVCSARLYLPSSRPGWGGFGSLASLDPRRLRWEDCLGPHQSEITHEDIVTLEQQEAVKHKQLTRVLKPHHCMGLIYHNTDLFPFTGAERADQAQTVSMTLRITQNPNMVIKSVDKKTKDKK